MTTFQHATVHGVKLFYREAGSKTSPTIVLLHGFPSSSHMFRDLIPQLAHKFHVIAPDYVGFGYSDAPDAGQFDYTFDNLAAHVEELLFGAIGLKKFSIYVQDYGAPVGYRIASRHPDAIEGIVVQERECLYRGHRSGLRPNEAVLGESQSRGREACARPAQERHHHLPVHARNEGCFADQSGLVHRGSTLP
jgi:pimeloyl-ACP methyl ester carboxylesterase